MSETQIAIIEQILSKHTAIMDNILDSLMGIRKQIEALEERIKELEEKDDE